MNVGGLRLDGMKNPLQELLEKQTKELQEELPAAALSVTETLAEESAASGGDKVKLSSRQVLAQASSSIMSRSFTHAGSAADNMSDYVQANMAAAEAAKSLTQSLYKTMAAALSELGVTPEEVSSPASASQAMRRVSNKQTGEAHERNLDEMEKKLEEKTEEVMAPVDANGNPIQVGPEGGEVSAPDIELEIAPPAQAAASAAAVLPENLAPEAVSVAPQAPKINLVV